MIKNNIGIEGVTGPIWHSLGANLRIPAKLLQLMKSRNEDDLNEIVNSVIEEIHQSFINQKKFFVVGHSFGTLIALKIASMLENLGQIGHVVLIDGSPEYLQRLAQGLRRAAQTKDSIENDLIMVLFSHFCSSEHLDVVSNKVVASESLTSKIEVISEFALNEFKENYSQQYLHNILVAIFHRLKVVMNLSVKDDEITAVMDKKLKSAITLIRPTQASFTDIVEDYSLHKYTEHGVTIKYVDGNHLTVLENVELANILNELALQTESRES